MTFIIDKNIGKISFVKLLLQTDKIGLYMCNILKLEH